MPARLRLRRGVRRGCMRTPPHPSLMPHIPTSRFIIGTTRTCHTAPAAPRKVHSNGWRPAGCDARRATTRQPEAPAAKRRLLCPDLRGNPGPCPGVRGHPDSAPRCRQCQCHAPKPTKGRPLTGEQEFLPPRLLAVRDLAAQLHASVAHEAAPCGLTLQRLQQQQ